MKKPIKDMSVKQLLLEISSLPINARGEIIQLELGLGRQVGEIRVIEKFTEIMAPALKVLEERGYVLKSKKEFNGCTWFIAKDKKLLEEAMSLCKRPIQKSDEERFGELMGYPKTAIESFHKRETLRSESLDSILGFKPLIFSMAFSRDRNNLMQELVFLARSYEAVLEYAPELIDYEIKKEKIMCFIDRFIGD